jgi:predicted Zn finger-like uncharacterized protein
VLQSDETDAGQICRGERRRTKNAMKVQCGQCPAKYAVSDERVRDRKVRIHCKRCGASIVVDGKVDPPLITSTPARPSVRPPTHPVPHPERPLPERALPDNQPLPEPEHDAQPSPRPVAHTIMGGLEAPAAERLQQQREAPARPGRSPASPFEAYEAEAVSHMPAEHRGLTEPPAGTDENRWRVALTKQDLRWMTTHEIVEAFRSGAVKHETFVFRSGMPTWVTLLEVPEIAAALAEAVGNGELSASALSAHKPPSSRPPPRRAPVRSGASEANAFATLAELDSAEPLPFALVAERSNGATAGAFPAPEGARHFPAPAPAHADAGPAYAYEPPEPERPSIERLSIEAMPVDHLSHIPDEPFAPPPFAAAQQAAGSSKWVWVVVLLLLLGAAAAFVASRQGLKLF